jgi:hypothetical protein
MSIKNLNLDIDNESVHIYIDYGEDVDVISICYWHIDEVEEDSSCALSIASAIQLYYTNPKELLTYFKLSNYGNKL